MKIFSIIGLTAVGKTSFALKAAQKVCQTEKYTGIDLISADSKQVYQGLEVISGADLPDDEFLQKNKIKFHGVSIIKPSDKWSVSHFQELALAVIKKAAQENRLVMIVGGTGLYHEQLFNSDPDLKVGPDQQVRQKAGKMELVKLQAWAEEISPARFSKMNNSDVNNPRRLIRVIEISLSSQAQKKKPNLEIDHLYVGLKQDLKTIEKKIKLRVEKRFVGGAVAEVKVLLAAKLAASSPVLGTLGVPEITQYLSQEITAVECQQLWALHELQYARRQLTWWQNKNVNWFDLGEQKWQERAQSYILKSC